MKNLEKALQIAHESIKLSQKVHTGIKQFVSDKGVDIQNIDSFQGIHTLCKAYLTPFSQVTHEPLDAEPIKAQITKLVEGNLPIVEGPFSTDDLNTLMILVMLCDSGNSPISDEISDVKRKELLYTLAALLPLFYGAHRGRGYISARWASIVSNDHGMVPLNDQRLVQKGLSQGFKTDNSVSRALRDLEDIKEFQSSLHWLANKILAYEVSCADQRYRPLSFAINIAKASAQMLYSHQPLETCEMLSNFAIDLSPKYSENFLGINSTEWHAHVDFSCQIFIVRSQKRSKPSHPEETADSKMTQE